MTITHTIQLRQHSLMCVPLSTYVRTYAWETHVCMYMELQPRYTQRMPHCLIQPSFLVQCSLPQCPVRAEDWPSLFSTCPEILRAVPYLQTFPCSFIRNSCTGLYTYCKVFHIVHIANGLHVQWLHCCGGTNNCRSNQHSPPHES